MKLILLIVTLFTLQTANSTTRYASKMAKTVKLNTKNVCSLDSRVDATSMKSVKKCLDEKDICRAPAIVQGLPGNRYVVEHGVFMFHRARGGVQGQFENGELESRLKLWKTIVRKMEEMQAKRIDISLAEYKTRRVNEWWLYGDDTVKENVADSVTAIKCTAKLSSQKTKKEVRTFFGTRKVEKSGCPLVQ